MELTEKIKKVEKLIAEHEEKIQKYQEEIKAIRAEEDKKFSNELLNIMTENGFLNSKDRKALLAEIRKITKKAAAFQMPEGKKTEDVMVDGPENKGQNFEN